MADHRGRYDGGVTGDVFYEWLLLDHPDARAEQERRRAACHQHQKENPVAVRAWVGKVNAQADAPAGGAGPGCLDRAAGGRDRGAGGRGAQLNLTRCWSPAGAPSSRPACAHPGRLAPGNTGTRGS